MRVWVLTLYSHDSIKMYEFESKEEALRESSKLSGYKVLTEVIYFTDFEEADVMQERELSFAGR
ncbi:hypothetical protein [Schinkia azotoformans]|uniref:hypothetical protein n=1 Tax=Schinkia azotoformans TaxID=1454 RepID=UPI00398AF2B1